MLSVEFLDRDKHSPQSSGQMTNASITEHIPRIPVGRQLQASVHFVRLWITAAGYGNRNPNAGTVFVILRVHHVCCSIVIHPSHSFAEKGHLNFRRACIDISERLPFSK